MLKSGTLLGPYDIMEPPGSGGMGDVSRARDTRLQRISAYGGSSRNMTSVDFAIGDVRHTSLQLIASTRTLLFTVIDSNPGKNPVESVSLNTGERRLIIEKASGARYPNGGHLVLRRCGLVMVAPFDPKKLALLGQAVPLRDEIRRAVQDVPRYAVSPGGTLAFVPALDDATFFRTIPLQRAS